MEHKFAQIAKEWNVKRDVCVIATGVETGRLILVYRIVTQLTCPHDAKIKMAGYEDRYECTRCQKIIQRIIPNEDMKDNGENAKEDSDYKFDLTKGVRLTKENRL